MTQAQPPAMSRPSPNSPSPGRSSPGADRYSRHRAIAGFSQEALQALHVLVIGAGAIGNEVVKNLCLLGVGRIDVYDLDRVEIHNLTRSVLLREADIGQSKAEAVVARARELDPAVRLRAIDGDIRDTLGPAEVAEADVLIGALDNFEARLWVNRLCHAVGRRWVNAAIDHRHASVEAFALAAATESTPMALPATPLPGAAATPACYECSLPDSVYARIAERYSCGGLQRAALAQKVMPTTTLTASLAAALAVEQALRPPSQSRRTLIDSQSGHATVATLAARADCPGCGGQPPGHLSLVRQPAISLHALAAWANAEAPGETLHLAEALIWSARCQQCGDTAATRALPGHPARTVSDTATFCFGCGTEAVAIDIRDTADAEDLTELAQRIGDRPLPLAFASVGPYLLATRALP